VLTVAIPARLSSTRLPGKMLANLCGKPVLRHVWDGMLHGTQKKKQPVMSSHKVFLYGNNGKVMSYQQFPDRFKKVTLGQKGH
jgi:hypothetical protein